MDFLRQYFWLWIIIGTLLATFVICLIFCLINRCMLRKDYSKETLDRCNTSEFSVQAKAFHPTAWEEEAPPLPPRTLDSNSYESIDVPPDYVKVEEEEAPQPLLHSREISQFREIPYSDDNTSTEDYDDIGKVSEDGEDYDDVG